MIVLVPPRSPGSAPGAGPHPFTGQALVMSIVRDRVCRMFDENMAEPAAECEENLPPRRAIDRVSVAKPKCRQLAGWAHPNRLTQTNAGAPGRRRAAKRGVGLSWRRQSQMMTRISEQLYKGQLMLNIRQYPCSRHRAARPKFERQTCQLGRILVLRGFGESFSMRINEPCWR
jgi:hypothetical protein